MDPRHHRVQRWKLPERFGDANPDTGVFGDRGTCVATGRNGVYGRFIPVSGWADGWEAPRGCGPDGITETPAGYGLAGLASR